ncbi:hypothetical protein ACS0TY_008171 [Phlomoides rotata]
MAVTNPTTFDRADIDLLCDEDTQSFLCFENGDVVESFDDPTEKNGNGGSDSEPFILFPCPSEEHIGWMVMREKEHLPRDDYLTRLRRGELDLSMRREALDWMIKVYAHHNFGEMSLYLAMNYLDRFLSVCSIHEGNGWTIQLAAISCLLIAAKFEEVYVPSTLEMQAGESKLVFEGKTIQRMEIMVMVYLKWNMKPYTPFNFIEYFLRKMNDDDEFSKWQLITRSIQVILSTIKGIDFLEFKASEIAAAVALYVSGEIHTMDVDKALPGSIVDKDRVVKGLELIKDLMSIGGMKVVATNTKLPTGANVGDTLAALPYSPNGVLDVVACLSKSIDERTTPIETNKRMKLNQQTPLDDAN